jgi:glycosyltransferase involved in cell wall biosynthesis
VATICEGLKSEIISRGIPAERVTIIPNCVDEEMFERDAEGGGRIRSNLAQPGTTLVGFLGSFYQWEGLHLLLSSASELQKQGFRFRLVIAGGGPEEGSLPNFDSVTR